MSIDWLLFFGYNLQFFLIQRLLSFQFSILTKISHINQATYLKQVDFVTRNDINCFVSKSKLLQRLNQSALVDLLLCPGHQNCKMMHANKSRKMKHQLPKIPQLLKSNKIGISSSNYFWKYSSIPCHGTPRFFQIS